MDVRDLTRDQLLQLKEDIYFSQVGDGQVDDEYILKANEYEYCSEIPNSLVYEAFEGISFTPDDFACTSGTELDCSICTIKLAMEIPIYLDKSFNINLMKSDFHSDEEVTMDFNFRDKRVEEKIGKDLGREISYYIKEKMEEIFPMEDL